jgi:hypothetical protein
MLDQKIALETFELTALATANHDSDAPAGCRGL